MHYNDDGSAIGKGGHIVRNKLQFEHELYNIGIRLDEGNATLTT